MAETQRPAADKQPFVIASRNMLLDIKRTRNGLIRPQSERLASHVLTLEEFHLSHDVVGVQEAYEDNGQLLAGRLGYPDGYWFEHNKPAHKGARRGRVGEHIGVFGALVNNATPIEVGHNRLAVKVMIGETALYILHLISEVGGHKRGQELDVVLKDAEGHDKAGLVGDFNSHKWEWLRLQLGRRGFKSAFKKVGKSQPPTFPVPEYYDVILGEKTKKYKLLRGGVALDDIYVKGLHVFDAGLMPEHTTEYEPEFDDTGAEIIKPQGASDHFSPYAVVMDEVAYAEQIEQMRQDKLL